MPQLIGLAFLAVGVYAASRLLKRQLRRMERTLSSRRGKEAKPVPLDRDPRTGRYRPRENR